MIRTLVNAGDFLKSILRAGDFKRQFRYGYYIKNVVDPRPILKNWNVWPGM